MKLGLHISQLHLPGRPGAAGRPDPDRRSRRRQRVREGQRDGSRLADRPARPARARDARGVHHAGLRGRAHPRATARLGDRGDLPRPGLLAKVVSTLDVLSGGRAVARHRRGLERAGGTTGSGCRSRPPPSGSSGSRRHCRSACRCGATTTARIDGKHYQLERHALTAPAASAAAAAHPDRRRRRAEDAATRGAVRGRVQPVRRARGDAQARGAPRALRAGGAATTTRSRRPS